jgi:cytochrome c-type biogenesis protein CcsB
MKKQPAWVPWVIVGIAVFYLFGNLLQFGGAGPDEFDFAALGTLPVQEGGRVQPFDTFARVRLMQISHVMSATYGRYEKDPDLPERDIIKDSRQVSPSQWALDVMAAPLLAGDRKHQSDIPAFSCRVFRIDYEQLVDHLKLPKRPGSWRYSYDEFADKEEFNEQIKRLMDQDGPDKNNMFDVKLNELWLQNVAFVKLAKLQMRLIPPPGGVKNAEEIHWLTLGDAFQDGRDHKALDYYRTILQSYIDNQPSKFNEAVSEYQKYLRRSYPSDYSRARVEAFFNHFAPFAQCIVLYGAVFTMAILSWLLLGWSRTLQTAAYWLTVLTLIVHSTALIIRIYLTGRPPVTNLYSSAIFIGWGAVGLGLLLEYLYKHGVGLVIASATGMLSLIVAHNLVTGDTMEMLQAVLDTNFWLATHVICVTFGYAATFIAGMIGVAYVILGVFTNLLRRGDAPAPRSAFDVAIPRASTDLGAELTKMIYGVTCFATLLSFVGTVLGGVWADESWGRFWGWDPKENGALLIVIWNALILHARWGGVVKARGLANLAVFGNCVVAWSWFGTNLLGVGLHSYGFMQGAMMWLSAFVVSQLVIIGIGCLPLSVWMSFAPRGPSEASPGKATVIFSP